MSEYVALKVGGVARYDLPAPLAREIGRFLVTWAHFEYYAQAIVWVTLGLGQEEGRIAVREPRVIDRLDMIRDLALFQNREMDFVLLKDIRVRAEPLAGRRHLLAHGIWQKFSNEWCVLVTRGSWPEPDIEIPDYPASNKTIQPEAFPINVEDLRQWREATVSLIEDMKHLGDQHRHVPLPEKRKKRSAPKGQTHGHKGSKHKPPHPSSGE